MLELIACVVFILVLPIGLVFQYIRDKRSREWDQRYDLKGH